MFNNNNIINSTKNSNINAKNIILDDEKEISENRELKKSYTFKIIIIAICLLVYWIILMLIYEKDKKYILDYVDDEELFKKYNPMIAGCIQGSRQILARDIIAVILNLINKKVITMDMIPSTSKKEPYRYVITKNEENYNKLDNIEQYVYDWVFDGDDKVDLKYRLEKMPKEKDANKKFKELNKTVEEELAKKGANEAKVPLVIRGFNIFLFVLSLVLVYKHISFNGFNLFLDADGIVFTITTFLIIILPFIPLVMGLIQVFLNILIMIRHKVNKTVQKVTGQKVATTTISTIVFFGIIIIITAIFIPAKFLIADEILICIATILVLTDNLMLKNDAIMIEDYGKLNTLKKKIEDYTLLKDKNIEYVQLWKKYLCYAVSFGISNKIINCIDGLNIDDDLEKLVSSEFMSSYLDTNYYYFYNNASLDKIFMKRYGEITRDSIGKWTSSSGGGSSGGGGGFSGGGSSSSGGGGSGGGRRSILKYLI